MSERALWIKVLGSLIAATILGLLALVWPWLSHQFVVCWGGITSLALRGWGCMTGALAGFTQTVLIPVWVLALIVVMFIGFFLRALWVIDSHRRRLQACKADQVKLIEAFNATPPPNPAPGFSITGGRPLDGRHIPWKTGDVVQLKSGGPVMTVSSGDYESGGMLWVSCVWFDGTTQKCSNFPASSIQRFKDEPIEN